jgi:hypothetical protein
MFRINPIVSAASLIYLGKLWDSALASQLFLADFLPALGFMDHSSFKGTVTRVVSTHIVDTYYVQYKNNVKFPMSTT